MIDLIRRQIELLKLLSKQREYKPASFFSKSLDVSTKTIYTDITYLQSEVEKYKVDLVRAPRIGIRLEGEKENIQHMLRDLQKDNLSEDEKYTPVNTEGNSAFSIPVKCFDEKLPVTADTVAMGTPHEIEYTLQFDSETIEKAK